MIRSLHPFPEWNELPVDSWQQFTDALEPYLDSYRTPPTYVFRGQPDAAWLLEPSLLRRLRGISDRVQAQEIEQLIENEFIAQASLFPEVRAVASVLLAAGHAERWAYMQHHSCPTRLLDWTASPFVAAYFAVEQCPEKNGAIFAVAPDALEQYARRQNPALIEITDDSLVDPGTPDRVTFTWPHLRSSRIVAQQGHFSLSTNILTAHDQPILEACSAIAAEQGNRVIHRKIIVPPDLKIVVLQQLRAMNVAPHALFPTVDGLGRSLSDLVALKVAFARAQTR